MYFRVRIWGSWMQSYVQVSRTTMGIIAAVRLLSYLRTYDTKNSSFSIWVTWTLVFSVLSTRWTFSSSTVSECPGFESLLQNCAEKMHSFIWIVNGVGYPLRSISNVVVQFLRVFSTGVNYVGLSLNILLLKIRLNI